MRNRKNLCDASKSRYYKTLCFWIPRPWFSCDDNSLIRIKEYVREEINILKAKSNIRIIARSYRILRCRLDLCLDVIDNGRLAHGQRSAPRCDGTWNVINAPIIDKQLCVPSIQTTAAHCSQTSSCTILRISQPRFSDYFPLGVHH